MRAGARPLLLLLVLLACSDLNEQSGGVVGLEIRTPAFSTIEVGEALQLTATALDKDGNNVPVNIEWRAPDPTLDVTAAGLITGLAPGTGRVQAFVGSLSSSLVSFTVIARADTLIVTDSVLTVAPEAAASPPMVVRLESFASGPLPDRPVAYVITSPPPDAPRTVELPGGVVGDTVQTGTDGAVSTMTLNRVSGTLQPDTAFVEVRAFRTRGAIVPGTGQRFIVIFQ